MYRIWSKDGTDYKVVFFFAFPTACIEFLVLNLAQQFQALIVECNWYLYFWHGLWITGPKALKRILLALILESPVSEYRLTRSF
jgi:hypothetical protein